jgi:signal transduction histidine kinase
MSRDPSDNTDKRRWLAVNRPAQHAGVEGLVQEVAELRRRLEEAEETIRAIREDEVDAFVVSQGEADRVLTLEAADRPYRRYVEAMRQAAVTLSCEGTILYANRAFAQLVMRPLEAVVGSSIGLFLAASCRPILNEVIARRPDGRGEALLERSDGVIVPVHLTASGSAEEPDIVCLVITDLTDQRRLAEVTAAEMLSRSILEQAVDAIVVGDRSGTLIRAGAAARQLCGKDPIGLAFEASFPLRLRSGPEGSDSATPTPSWIDRVLSGETICGAEARLDREDGQQFDLLLGSGPLTDAEGCVVGFVATLTDITELREAEKALREADRRKDEFLAMLAHELRNPLSAIGNAAEVARQSPDDEEARTWSAEIIERQVQQLGHLVDDLLDVSRISRGKIQFRKELIDARSIVERAAQVVRPQMAEKGHELSIAVHEGRMAVEADPTRLEQILVNLLSNAVKYTDAGGRITLSAWPEGGELVLRVEDTGIGIAPEKLPLVFELFEQVDDSIARSRGGLGIGLTLVKRLAELHGGTVAAESEGLGRGSTFSVRLPLAGQRIEVGTKTESPSLPGKSDTRILIVDDNIDSVAGLAKLLRRQGYEVETAHDGPSALEVASTRRPAFVLLDIGLPGMDGYQVAERLRTLLGERVTICAVSGYGREEDRRRGQEAGFDHHLIKPVDYNKLMTLLADAGSRQ